MNFFCVFFRIVEKHYLLEPQGLGNRGRTCLNRYVEKGHLEGAPGELPRGYEDFIFHKKCDEKITKLELKTPLFILSGKNGGQTGNI